MLDIGWTEIAIIAVIALLVVGPKDLPGVVRSFGRWTGKARKQARDFQRSFENLAEENELTEIRKEIEEANRELAAAGRIPDEERAPRGAPAGANPGPARARGPAGGASGGEALGATRAATTATSVAEGASGRPRASPERDSGAAVAPPKD